MHKISVNKNKYVSPLENRVILQIHAAIYTFEVVSVEGWLSALLLCYAHNVVVLHYFNGYPHFCHVSRIL